MPTIILVLRIFFYQTNFFGTQLFPCCGLCAFVSFRMTRWHRSVVCWDESVCATTIPNQETCLFQHLLRLVPIFVEVPLVFHRLPLQVRRHLLLLVVVAVVVYRRWLVRLRHPFKAILHFLPWPVIMPPIVNHPIVAFILIVCVVFQIIHRWIVYPPSS